MINAPPRSRANAALSPTRAWTIVRLIGLNVLALDEVLGRGFGALSSLAFERECRARRLRNETPHCR